MQQILDIPRAGGSAGDVRALLGSSPSIQTTCGLEMLVLEHGTSLTRALQTDPLDISDILIADGSSVGYDNTAVIGGAATLTLDPDVWSSLGHPTLEQQYAAPTAGTIDQSDWRLYWGNPRTRLRPYLTLSSPSVPTTAKFYLGLYIPASPTAPMDTSAPKYTVTCYDQTAIFDVEIQQSLYYPTGTNVLSTVQGIISMFDALLTPESPLVLVSDTSAYGKALAADQAFTVGSNTTWLTVINSLLNSVGYNTLWADFLGQLHVSNYVDPRTRTPEWVFDATDPLSGVVDPTSTWSPDVWAVPNRWVFTQNGLVGTPTEGLGQYTVVNQSSGPTSIDKQRGRVIPKFVSLDAVDQPSLVQQGNAIVAQDSAIGETWTVKTAPLPIAGYQDVIQLISNNVETNLYAAAQTQARLCVAQAWTLPLDGSDMTWTLGTIG